MRISEAYAVLGASKDSTKEEITAAYAAMARACNPAQYADRPKLFEEAQAKLAEVNKAKDVLISRGKTRGLRSQPRLPVPVTRKVTTPANPASPRPLALAIPAEGTASSAATADPLAVHRAERAPETQIPKPIKPNCRRPEMPRIVLHVPPLHSLFPSPATDTSAERAEPEPPPLVLYVTNVPPAQPTGPPPERQPERR